MSNDQNEVSKNQISKNVVSKHEVSRRAVLVAGTGGAVTGILGSPAGLTAAVEPISVDIYKELGIRRIINAAGSITALGGSIMPPEVIAAWNAAATGFVDLIELQNRVGERIAQRLGVDAALVTTGAAGGILLGTAAAITYRDRSLVSQLPMPPQAGLEVIRQKSHRQCYDNQVTSCGVRLVDVETPEQLEQAISPKTVLMFSYNVNEGESTIPRSRWIEIAKRRNVPMLLDAAADTPPVDALWKYNHLGYDLVVFSGGKAIRGPQGAGLLLGRKDLIEAAKLNTSPRCGNIGRGLKVSKEDMVAMWAAIERFVKLDHEAERAEWAHRISVIEQELKNVPTVKTERITPPIANQVPHLIVHWDEARLKITPAEMKLRLASGEPPIATARVHGTGDKGFLISVFMLQRGEEMVVAKRCREVLEAAMAAK